MAEKTQASKGEKGTKVVQEKGKDATPSQKPASKPSSVTIPSVQDLFKAGVQFGHQTARWNPKMKEYIYDARNGIHIIDVTKTRENLKKAVDFLSNAASKGDVIFVGTKKQSSDIIKDNAINSGAHFVNQRWAGGILTNFKKVKESFIKLRELETMFEKGVEGRTKYEISLMKKDWQKLNRLYSGVKTMDKMPEAVVVVDTRYEKGAVREALNKGIPVIGICDTNADPDSVDYVIPANDDAISSIKELVQVLANAVKEGNKGNGIKHHLKDYSKFEVQIIRKEQFEVKDKTDEVKLDMPEETARPGKVRKVIRAPQKSKGVGQKGILEKVQEERESKKGKTEKPKKEKSKK